jgi:hypothetical protein
MKYKSIGGNIKSDWSSIIIITIIILVLCLIWGNNSSRNNKVYSPANKAKRESVIEAFADTPNFVVKTRNKDKTFSKTEMLIEASDLQYYKTLKADPKTSFIFKDQNINMPYRVDAGIDNDGGAIHNINNYDLVGNDVYDEIFEPIRNREGELIEIFDDRDDINPHRNLQVTLHDADAQNVHDTAINRTVRKIYSTIDINQNTNTDKLIKEIILYADIDKSPNDIKKIKLVLDKVLERNAKITNVGGKTELELLDAIWREAAVKPEPTRSNIRDMLLVQIGDTYDNHTKSVLCPTGFSNRISVALITETPELFPKTKELLNEEILESASFIRAELEDDKGYMSLNDSEQHEIFKKKLYSKLTLDYRGMLSLEEIKELTAPWIDHI